MSSNGVPGRWPRRYALVGTGHRAEMYVRALLGPHAGVGELVGLCDPNPARRAYHQQVVRAARPGSAPVAEYGADDFAAMLAGERPDVVIVTTVDRLHARYIVAALDAGCDVITEKPLTTDVEGCRQITDAVRRSGREVTVTFNYRYSPRNAALRRLIAEGEIGRVTSVHFEWVLDTAHGADYFRRWHRDKAGSGGLLVHKATHHFDLVNWWLDDVPHTVYAQGGLMFYGAANAAGRGLGPRPGRSRDAAAPDDPFALDLASSPRLRALYLDAETHDGYLRDLDVFGEGITIEDNMAVLARYTGGPILSYALNAHAPWEGYRVAVNGTEGRAELAVCERADTPTTAGLVVGGDDREDSPVVGGDGREPAGPRRAGVELLVQRHWEPARRVDVDVTGGAHGGGDDLLLHDLFRGTAADPLGRRASCLDGVRSVLVGIAAGRSIETGRPVELAELAAEAGVRMPGAVQH